MDRSIKILATADLHLGRSSSNVVGEHASTKFTLQNITQYCIDKNIDILLLCGDILDWDNRFFEAYGPLQNAFDQLGQHEVEVYLVAGNHDFSALPQIIETGNNPHVHLLGKYETWEVKSFSKYGQTVQFIGWSFARRYVKESALDTWDASILNPNYPTIGLLHGDIDVHQSNYGPIRSDDLRHTNIALWILGHIHRTQKLLDKPQVWYTGSPQALSAKEPGIHGPLLITIAADQTLEVEQIPMSPIRYEAISIDITGVQTENELRDKIVYHLDEAAGKLIEELEEVKSLVYQITLVGRSHLAQEMEDWKKTVIDHQVRLETGTQISVRRVDTSIRPAISDLNQLAQQSSPVGILAHTILAIEENRTDEFLEGLIEDWMQQITHVNRIGTYSPLNDERKLENTSEQAKLAIKAACNRLLGELLNQVSKAQ